MMTRLFKTPDSEWLKFDFHEMIWSIYGRETTALGRQHAAGRRHQPPVWHLIIEVCGSEAPFAEDLVLDGYIREAVSRSHASSPRVRIHAWAYWRYRMELLINGPRKLQDRVVGQIKSGVTRRFRTLSGPFVGWSDTWGVPIESAAQRLTCINHLRTRMNELATLEPNQPDSNDRTAGKPGPGLHLVT